MCPALKKLASAFTQEGGEDKTIHEKEHSVVCCIQDYMDLTILSVPAEGFFCPTIVTKAKSLFKINKTGLV